MPQILLRRERKSDEKKGGGGGKEEEEESRQIKGLSIGETGAQRRLFGVQPELAQ